MRISNDDIWFAIAGLVSSGALIHSACQLYKHRLPENSWAKSGCVIINVLGLVTNSYFVSSHYAGLKAFNAGVDLFICGLITAIQCGLTYCCHSTSYSDDLIKKPLMFSVV